MNLTVNYDISIYEKWLLIKDKYEETKDNKLIAKIFEWYTCIKLSKENNKNFYEYNDINPDFKEENQMTKNDTGIDCCDMEDTIVQCKLRSKSLTWEDCATFFGSSVIYDEINKRPTIKWNNLVIARNSSSTLCKNLRYKSKIFIDKTYD